MNASTPISLIVKKGSILASIVGATGLRGIATALQALRRKGLLPAGPLERAALTGFMEGARGNASFGLASVGRIGTGGYGLGSLFPSLGSIDAAVGQIAGSALRSNLGVEDTRKLLKELAGGQHSKQIHNLLYRFNAKGGRSILDAEGKAVLDAAGNPTYTGAFVPRKIVRSAALRNLLSALTNVGTASARSPLAKLEERLINTSGKPTSLLGTMIEGLGAHAGTGALADTGTALTGQLLLQQAPSALGLAGTATAGFGTGTLAGGTDLLGLLLASLHNKYPKLGFDKPLLAAKSRLLAEGYAAAKNKLLRNMPINNGKAPPSLFDRLKANPTVRDFVVSPGASDFMDMGGDIFRVQRAVQKAPASVKKFYTSAVLNDFAPAMHEHAHAPIVKPTVDAFVNLGNHLHIGDYLPEIITSRIPNLQTGLHSGYSTGYISPRVLRQTANLRRNPAVPTNLPIRAPVRPKNIIRQKMST